VQAEKYANEPATRCNSFIATFIAAFILFYFTCAAGLTRSNNDGLRAYRLSRVVKNTKLMGKCKITID